MPNPFRLEWPCAGEHYMSLVALAKGVGVLNAKSLLYCLLLSQFVLLVSGNPGNRVTVGAKVETIDKLVSTGFSLNQQAEVDIQGWGASLPSLDQRSGHLGELLYSSWIIDSNTRKKVWHSLGHSGSYKHYMGTFKIKTRIQLAKGDYELYLIGVQNTRIRYKPRGKYRELSLTHIPEIYVSAPAEVMTTFDPELKLKDLFSRAVVTINRVGNNSSEVCYFRLKKEARLRLYALGEGERREGSIFDYAWIEDLTRSRKVWTMNLRTCDRAGGSSKNLLVQEYITLPPGKYAVHYDTDGSHAYGQWSYLPPNDPCFWGITLWPARKQDLDRVVFIRKKANVQKPILAMTKVSNNQHLRQGMELKKDMGLRLFCLGEGTWRKGMIDYGWIENAETGQTVWVMKLDNSVDAGGADKNRMINEVLQLKAGKYVAHFQTDNSHAYANWNNQPPIHQERWGMMIWPQEQSDTRFVSLFNTIQTLEKPLAALERPGNEFYQEQPFELKDETRLKVVALGEGQDNEMADYGWIESDDTGRIVWQMTYSRTEHAGGAEKNRLIEDLIVLPKGNYKLLFETDDSHAYRMWNDKPPDTPERFGIAIFVAK